MSMFPHVPGQAATDSDNTSFAVDQLLQASGIKPDEPETWPLPDLVIHPDIEQSVAGRQFRVGRCPIAGCVASRR